MKLNPIMLAILSLGVLPSLEIEKKSKKQRDNQYAFLDPRNQGYSYIRSGYGGVDYNSRAQFIGRRAMGLRRIAY